MADLLEKLCEMGKRLIFLLVTTGSFSCYAQSDSFESTPIEERVDKPALALKSKKTGIVVLFFEGDAVSYKARGGPKTGLIEAIDEDFVVIGNDKIAFSSLKSISRYVHGRADAEMISNTVNPNRTGVRPYLSVASNFMLNWSDSRSVFDFRKNRSFIVAGTAVMAAALVTQIVQNRRAHQQQLSRETFFMRDYEVSSILKN